MTHEEWHNYFETHADSLKMNIDLRKIPRKHKYPFAYDKWYYYKGNLIIRYFPKGKSKSFPLVLDNYLIDIIFHIKTCEYIQGEYLENLYNWYTKTKFEETVND